MNPAAGHVYIFSIPLLASLSLLIIALYDFMSETARAKTITTRAIVSLVSMLVAQAIVFTFV